MDLWEILVPCQHNDGRPIHTRHHKVWDKKVYDITGGLTIMMPAKGKWVSPNKELFIERMIPVRIACSREQINKIIDMTLKYYNQECIMAYRVADEVIMRFKHGSPSKGS